MAYKQIPRGEFRMLNRMLLCFAAWTFVAGTLNAQPAMLNWKFEKGRMFDCERSVTQTQSVEMNGKTFKSTRNSTWHIRLQVDSRMRVLATLTKVEHRITPANADELLDGKLAEKMQGSTFTLTVAPSGQLMDIAGYDAFLDRLSKDDPAKRKALRATLSEATMREAFADLFGPLPSDAVTKGAAWQRTYVEPIPHFGSLRSTASYVYAGSTDQRDRIDYSIATKYQVPKDDKSVLLRVTKGDITSDDAQGVIVFDRRMGHVVQHKRRMRLRGSLTVDVKDRASTIGFASDTELKIRFKQ